MVAPEAATSRHQVRGWKRSSCITQPAARIIAVVDTASAFMWNSGSGVIRRSSPCAHRAQPAFVQVALPDVQEVEVAEQAALGLAGGARGVEQGAFGGAAALAGRRAGPRAFARDDRGCLAVREHVVELGGAVVRVERHDARAERVEREEMQQELGAVRQLQRDPVPGAVAARRDSAAAIRPTRSSASRVAVARSPSAQGIARNGFAAVRRGGTLEGGEDRRHSTGW